MKAAVLDIVLLGDLRIVAFRSAKVALFANGEPWSRLSSAVTTYHSALIYLTNPAFSTVEGDVAAGTLTLAIRRTIDEGIHEAFEVTNHNQATVRYQNCTTCHAKIHGSNHSAVFFR